ncbi:hypothetical protein KCP69_04090 [Salmonella enterica subsp. enterica]|nr:hypothetical protein KCP69_04090 [Salmonella enterica subsp. enterica]
MKPVCLAKISRIRGITLTRAPFTACYVKLPDRIKRADKTFFLRRYATPASHSPETVQPVNINFLCASVVNAAPPGASLHNASISSVRAGPNFTLLALALWQAWRCRCASHQLRAYHHSTKHHGHGHRLACHRPAIFGGNGNIANLLRHHKMCCRKSDFSSHRAGTLIETEAEEPDESK